VTALWVVVTVGLAGLSALVVAIILRPIRLARESERLARAQRDFHRQREQLEAKFIDKAAASGKPRGLRWTDVSFDDAIVYARDRRSGLLKALVAVEVSFEAIAGGGAGLHLVNVANPAAPVLIRDVMFSSSVVSVAMRDGIAYAVAGSRLLAVDINTGELVKRLRRENHSPMANRIALLLARNFRFVEKAVRRALQAGSSIDRIFGKGSMESPATK
jgi:hypothetical protein